MSQSVMVPVAILLWPLFSVVLYRTTGFVVATVWTVLGAEMFLPLGAGIKLASGIPILDRTAVASLTIIVASVLNKGRIPSLLKGNILDKALVLCLVVSPIISSIQNTDPVVSGGSFLPGVSVYDGLSAAFSQAMFVAPFFVARTFFNEEVALEQVVRALVVACVIYSVPILFEVRFSPQLHAMIYGYFPSSFITEFRYGGFRPVVFMRNGLSVAVFMAVGVVAAGVFWSIRARRLHFPAGLVAGFLFVVVLLCKTLAAAVYSTVFTSLVMFCKPRTQATVAAALGLIVLAYPMLRSTGLFPTSAFVALPSYIDEDRSLSLKFRFDQEDELLDRANERVLFGWGRYGRNRVYDESGRDTSITDGRWVIQLGQFGLLGFLSEFGLFALVIFRSTSALRRVPMAKDGAFIGGAACILVLCFIDQIPNASLSSWTWLIAGALAARTGVLLRQPLQQRTATPISAFSTSER